MKTFKIIVLCAVLIFLCAMFGGCRSKKEFTSVSERVQIDTVYRENVRIDTVKITQLKEVTKPIYIEQEIPCSENQNGTVRSGGNSVYYEVKDGKVIFKTIIDSTESTELRERIVSKDSEIERLKSLLIEKDSEISNTKTYIAIWWHIPLMIIEGVVIVLLLILLFKEKIKAFIKWF
ncbi:hypothetical protein QO206_13380 [Leeuwenhoekiella aequorea]|uniref:hypothetical protein n=1 Tax=Leeuwenhoekiella aequorea TaxID=283736 RepID=UPI00352C0C40|tara:strand:+ start:395 stop:925 length:531 start_codon:yes stop_codon:yes gene_type:complete